MTAFDVDKLASTINRAQSAREPDFLSRPGHRVAAVIDADDLDRLTELPEDTAEIRVAQELRAEMRRTH